MARKTEEEKQRNRAGFEKRQAARLKAQGGEAGGKESGSGRGTIGPDKNRDSTKYGQTFAEKYGVTKGQKSQKSQAEVDDDRLVLVPRGEARAYEGAGELVDLSGQRKNNIILVNQTVGEERLVTKLDQPQHMAQAVQTAQALFAASTILVTTEPYRPNRIAEAKDKKLEYDIIMSTASARPRKAISSRPLTERTTRPTSESASKAGKSHSKLCANCGGDGHLVASCITAEDGSIRICVLCRSSGHLTDECKRFDKLSLADKVKLLVRDRANMPALATKQVWWVYLYELIDSKDNESIPAFTGFPWTVSFALKVFSGEKGWDIHALQAEFDSTHDLSLLPVNEAIKNLEDIWTDYWRSEFRARPHRLDEILRQSAGSPPEVREPQAPPRPEGSVCELSDEDVSDDDMCAMTDMGGDE
ncbi:hypothetical protein FOQG_04182 [Fusarium oxysporum f. sp. raphani 54005]|uniref:CCHC-type domain-containing protein n=2 Tax=Fusarium oxysporum f. sp. raphani TaxID=96318 RepID=X0DMQ4_FUSOX|nr:hypothetical protein FOQG_04182 [Fusarium oxysporum f. sp. raphani 54005]KAG7433387.1 hypothetical protein Forpi1262_v006883 [Fusarium oxysporum f. sp. raphani]